MKNIGYIYKYSPEEEKGILVYGSWENRIHKYYDWGTHFIHTKGDVPILFLKSDCVKEIATGQLVYFEFFGDCISNIEPASIENFDKQFYNYFIERMNNYSIGKTSLIHITNELNFTQICYENLNSIVINSPKIPSIEYDSKNGFSILGASEEENIHLHLLYSPHDFLDSDSEKAIYEKEIKENKEEIERKIILNEKASALPNGIDNIYNCFGRYNHTINFPGHNRANTFDDIVSVRIDLLDFSIWTNFNIISNDYKPDATELNYFHKLFIEMQRYSIDERRIDTSKKNKNSLSSWSTLLARYSTKELRTIIQRYPSLQNVMPVDFCKNNMDVLSLCRGLSDNNLYKHLCIYKARKVDKVSDYVNFYNAINKFGNYYQDLFGENIRLLNNDFLNELNNELENTYNKYIKNTILKEYHKLSASIGICSQNASISFTRDLTLKIGLLFEEIHNLSKDNYKWPLFNSILRQYDLLPEDLQCNLKQSVSLYINDAIIQYSKNSDITPSDLRFEIDTIRYWLNESTILNIRANINERFANIDDIRELFIAQEEDFISSSQCLDRAMLLSFDYNSYDYVKLIEEDYINFEKVSEEIKWFVLSPIIEFFNKKGYVDFEYSSSISELQDFIKFVWRKFHLKKETLQRFEEEIVKPLNSYRIESLIKKGLISFPGYNWIRNYLDQGYRNFHFDESISKNKCIQDVMLQDYYESSDSKIQSFIIESLDKAHLSNIYKNSTGLVKLHTWLQYTETEIEWDLIEHHFHELSEENQIKLFRYVFYLMATKKIPYSVDYFYEKFVNTTEKLCPSLCTILYLLKEKYIDPKKSFKSSEIDIFVNPEAKDIHDSFLDTIINLFFKCKNYLAILSDSFSTDYNGDLSINRIKNKTYYVINLKQNSFTESIKEILILNLSPICRDDSYYIPIEQEIEIRQFAKAYKIKDHGNLFNNYAYINELGQYKISEHTICLCGQFYDLDPKSNIPFFWCNKKVCVRNQYYLQPIGEWEEYKFPDLLFICKGLDKDSIDQIWDITSEISSFLDNYIIVNNIHYSCLDDIDF